MFKKTTDKKPFLQIKLDPNTNSTFHFWHIYVEDLKPGISYAYRVDGPTDTSEAGNRFCKSKVLLDPYAKSVTKYLWNRQKAIGCEDNLESSMRGVVVDGSSYDWEDDQPLNRPMNETIVYELHVGGFTKAKNSGCKYPGTFSAIGEKIPYLKSLGITAVELMPIFDFDETQVFRRSPEGKLLKDFWGYNTLNFFAPHGGYCVSPDEGNQVNEFRDMVKALHKAGIEVILDVVFSHTGEGNHGGPVVNLKGLDNKIYYYLTDDDKQYYMDFSGCGNTLNCNHPVVQKFIVDCLEYWVDQMHVDGFRFDEASILSRGESGTPLRYPPALWQIELSEKLSQAKIFAEAWDAAGLYQVGYFPGYRFGEWNGKFRDEVRRFVRGDQGLAGTIAQRISGSADIYQPTGHLPINSLNFLTCHDGFTLYDLVSYETKHNEQNGESGNDGINENNSANYGVEGETDDKNINDLRERQLKNLLALLLISRGIPMVLAGDEIKKTQHGNNNAYCQDNEVSYFDWSQVEKNHGLLRFFKHMVEFRKTHSALKQKNFFSGKINPRGLKDITWHGVKLEGPGWDNQNCQVLSFTLGGKNEEEDLQVMVNMTGEDLDFELAPVEGRRWFGVIDTSQPPPYDILASGKEKWLEQQGKFCVKSRSIVILVAK